MILKSPKFPRTPWWFGTHQSLYRVWFFSLYSATRVSNPGVLATWKDDDALRALSSLSRLRRCSELISWLNWIGSAGGFFDKHILHVGWHHYIWKKCCQKDNIYLYNNSTIDSVIIYICSNMYIYDDIYIYYNACMHETQVKYTCPIHITASGRHTMVHMVNSWQNTTWAVMTRPWIV